MKAWMCEVTLCRLKGPNWPQNTHSPELRIIYLFVISWCQGCRHSCILLSLMLQTEMPAGWDWFSQAGGWGGSFIPLCPRQLHFVIFLALFLSVWWGWYIMSTGDCGVQKRTSDTPEFQAFVSCLPSAGNQTLHGSKRS